MNNKPGSWLIRKFLIVFVISLLAGCSGSIKVFGPTIDELNDMHSSEAQAYIAGKTVMTYGGHGTQIEYMDTDGLAYLWYPGNRRTIPSRWNLRDLRNARLHAICFKYPTTSYNPLLGTNGGTWECDTINAWAKKIREVREGDIFNLSSGKVPWPLSRDSTTFDDLLKMRDGKSPAH